VIDLRTLLPWDRETVFASVRKTGKCLVLYEATETGAFRRGNRGKCGEHCFEALDGPVLRLGAQDTPIPFHPELEQVFQAKVLLKEKLADLLAY
jgi:2-oxoisovalerate dehydrogenase E1 component